MSTPNSPDAERFWERVRAVCPSFGSVDDEAAAEWQDKPHPLDYVRDWALVSHLAHLAEDGRFDLVAPVLSVAEEALATGDRFTRDLMVAGFLEDLQNALLRTEGRVRLVDVRDMLGPSCLAAWDLLMHDWYGPAEEARKRLPPGSLPADAR